MATHPRISAALRHCVRCGRHTDEVGRLSARGRCIACGGSAVADNLRQLHDHQGPYFDRWRTRLVAALIDS